jgi:hypothetical protein
MHQTLRESIANQELYLQMQIPKSKSAKNELILALSGVLSIGNENFINVFTYGLNAIDSVIFTVACGY